ncbi:uncharacterized protein LOC120664107 [Panicum virgatum]|uniref:uncharacterized protein LOC120664107 n=1 Tax=Panicum virgatum TaxID=38727 RepID=UPI0019D5167C|nr:uncharacterized protein LOC120664107 [Panicum virgatum]
MVQKHHPHSKNKKAAHKPVKTTTFKKKKTTNFKGGCYTCGDGGHFARDCPNRADRKAKANPGTGSKDVNMTTLASTEDGYGHPRFKRADGKWVTCFCSWCWYDRSEVYFEKDRAAEERAACPNYQQESSERLPSV